MQQLPTLNKCCMEMEGVRVLNGGLICYGEMQEIVEEI